MANDGDGGFAHRRALLRRIGSNDEDGQALGAHGAQRQDSPYGRRLQRQASSPPGSRGTGSALGSPASSAGHGFNVVVAAGVAQSGFQDFPAAREEIARITTLRSRQERDSQTNRERIAHQAGEVDEARRSLAEAEAAHQRVRERLQELARQESDAYVQARDALAVSIATARSRAEAEEDRLTAEPAQLAEWRAEAKTTDATLRSERDEFERLRRQAALDYETATTRLREERDDLRALIADGETALAPSLITLRWRLGDA